MMNPALLMADEELVVVCGRIVEDRELYLLEKEGVEGGGYFKEGIVRAKGLESRNEGSSLILSSISRNIFLVLDRVGGPNSMTLSCATLPDGRIHHANGDISSYLQMAATQLYRRKIVC